jgi:hypothetical protein
MMNRIVVNVDDHILEVAFLMNRFAFKWSLK